jgi:DNA-binding transcriptional MerR regulator
MRGRVRTDPAQAGMPIGELARRTGVRVATLRAWETRYGFLTPERSPGGRRLYREEDLGRVSALLELVDQGWTVGAAARRLADGAAPVALAAGSPASSGRDVDAEALVVVLEATRELIQMRDAAGGAEVLARAVERLGGTVAPAHPAPDDALPIDLSLGEGEPVLPVAEPYTLARMRLETLLPGLVEDAHRQAALVRRQGRAGPAGRP